MPRYRGVYVGQIRGQATARKREKEVVRTSDPATAEMLQRAEKEGVITAFHRYLAQQPQCAFGLTGICCRICIQGPCRVKRDEVGSRGVCGASDYTIVARNVARYIAGGASAHSDHARHIARTLLEVAEGRAPDYRIADPEKLRRVARRVGVPTDGKSDRELAKEVALRALEEFGRAADEPCVFLTSTITEGRRRKFKNCDIVPYAIDRSIVQVLHGTTMGMDADPVNIIFTGLRAALADYTGMHIATDLSDVLFGTPRPVRTEANLGAIDPDYVNIATHGHNPTLSEMVLAAAEELKAEAQAAGAKGVRVVGICCTGNELLMRQGVPLAANQSAQEMAIMTGALDAMIVDVQCIMPAVKTLAECYHTRVITTHPLAKLPASYHVAFREEDALASAREMVRLAIEAYKERDPDRVHIPSHRVATMAGFSLEALLELFGNVDRERPVRVLTDAIREGQLAGVCLFAGCTNQRVPHDTSHLTILKTLVENDVFCVATGCAAGAFARAGLATPAAVEQYAGEGLRRFLGRLAEAAGLEDGLPLVFHMGSCVDNTRAADLCTAMAEEMGVDVPKVPFVASAPEAMHEKAVSIGSWCVAMGLPVHVGIMPPVEGSPLVYGILTQIAHDVYGGHFIFEMEPQAAAEKLLAALEYRRWKLGIHQAAAKKFETLVAAHW